MHNAYSSLSQLEKAINNAFAKPVEETAMSAQAEFKKIIDEQYYNDPGFYPNVYERTQEFLNSVAYQMLSSNLAEVYIDIEGMHYRNGFDPWKVVKWASESKHGADYYQTGTQDFMSRFIDWCNDNLLIILKANLKKHGFIAK